MKKVIDFYLGHFYINWERGEWANNSLDGNYVLITSYKKCVWCEREDYEIYKL